MAPKSIILASGSPRRAQLLKDLGYNFEIQVPNIDESPYQNETSLAYSLRMALEKGRSISAKHPDSVVISADTIVVFNDEIIGKPKDKADFISIFQKLSNNKHLVISSIAVCFNNQIFQDQVTTEVTFTKISLEEMFQYWDTGEPRDKAGGYGIQGIGSQFVKSINGSYSNVVGLPQAELKEILHKL